MNSAPYLRILKENIKVISLRVKAQWAQVKESVHIWKHQKESNENSGVASSQSRPAPDIDDLGPE